MRWQDIYSYVVENGGATIDPVLLQLFEGKGYAVSLKGYESRVHESVFTPEVFFWLLSEYTTHAKYKGAFVGIWYDSDTGHYVLDLSVVYGDKETAMAVAKLNGQKAIWDFGTSEAIYVEAET